jgi:hypothetical protein
MNPETSLKTKSAISTVALTSLGIMKKVMLTSPMPKYVMKQLTRYAHPAPVKPQNCPFSPNPITYDKDNQATTPADDSPLLDNAGKK